MKTRKMKYRILIGVLSLLTLQVSARETKDIVGNQGNRTDTRVKLFAATCEAASQSADLDINNVRTKILNGGDMWWDLNNPKYEIPKVTDPNAVRKHSLFAGAIWVGGKDNGGNLRLAAMTYRQKGSDFWPGPLDTSNASTEPARCKNYDKLWKITRNQLEEFEESKFLTAATEIKNWPAGRERTTKIGNESDYMAPFFDKNGDKVYDPIGAGEYPTLYHSDPSDPNSVPLSDNGISRQPDQFIWYVYNDKGNIHSESQGQPIGLECRTTAFAFSTNDEINNMTFYTTELINWGTAQLNETYMGQWVDPDLGNYVDDYVGCDVNRSLGYCYNGDEEDEGVLGYGLNPPTIGVDYFQGPKDTSGKELGLSHFMYFTNSAPIPLRDPDIAIQFYNYLQGKWQNGTPLTWGATGYNPGSTDLANYAFPDNTDPDHATQNWVETARPGDRRFVQSTGPFTLLRGQVQRITTGVVWARTTTGGAKGSLELLKLASDKAQTLFNNSFKLVDGPESPDVEIQELNDELVLKLINTGTKKVEKYTEKFKNASGVARTYAFEGYLIYQLKDGTVSQTDLDNVDKARLLFQVDLKNNYVQIINKVFDPKISQYIPVEKVNGENKGIQHSFSIKKDLFATGSNTKLVNFKNYHYMVLSYAVLTDDPTQIEPNQFLAGRRNIKVQRATPHNSTPENFNTTLQSGYGSGPELTQIAGRGNGGNVLEFTKATIDKILSASSNGIDRAPTYVGGSGPVKVKVVDPLKVPNNEFELYFKERKPSTGGVSLYDSITAKTDWILVNKTTGDTVVSDTTLAFKYESMTGKNTRGTSGKLLDWGLSIEIEQVNNPGEFPLKDATNGIVSWSVKFQDEGKQWLTAVADNDGATLFFNLWQNWIRSGQVGRNTTTFDPYKHSFFNGAAEALDPVSQFQKIWNGRIAPYGLTARGEYNATTEENCYGFASAENATHLDNPLSELPSFTLVITPDRTKWTKCPVLEMCDNQLKASNEGTVPKFSLRKGTSRDRFLNPIAGETGFSYFPGYAINLETGERLQIAFGEDSYLEDQNGRDMIWNPTDAVYSSTGLYPAIGGKHAIYIFGTGYSMPNRSTDGSRYFGDASSDMQRFRDSLGTSATANQKRRMLSQINWVIPSYMANGFSMKDGIPLSEVTFTINMKKAYTTNNAAAANNGRPFYKFSGKTIAPIISTETGVKTLDLANIVPNPYKGFSEYQNSPVDTRVKITNLPPECTVSIFDLAGNFIRRFDKADDLTYIEWDLKNQSRVPIATGLYLIHIKCDKIGTEKVLRWYGVMPAIDLDSY